MLVATIFIVASRRIRVPKLGIGIIGLVIAGILILVRLALLSSPFLIDLSTIVIGGLLLFPLIGFQATALLVSAVFWAVFMNTLRILTIPLAEHFFEIDLASGISHDILGYSVLAIGILMILSTDQFLQFLFGPVEESDSGEMSSGISKFWNNIVSGGSNEEEVEKAKLLQRKPVTDAGRKFIFVCSGLIIALGLFQAFDAYRSWSQPEITRRFFDSDMIVDFEKQDMPVTIGKWKQVDYRPANRHNGADHGQRSDTWQYRSPAYSCSAIASLDQPFPGWHELTTCYRNQGWTLTKRKKIVPEAKEGEEAWPYIEASFKKDTGEKGYLVFSLFNSFGGGVNAPQRFGDFEWFLHSAPVSYTHLTLPTILLV